MPNENPSKSRGSRRRWLLSGLALLLASTVLSLAVAEVVLRKSGKYATKSELEGHGYRSAFDASAFTIPWIGFDLGAASSFQVSQLEFSYPVSVNSLGVRDDEHPVGKEPGELRIAVLGDSFVASHGVAWEHAWTEVLERSLQSTGQNVRVMAAGVPGHDPVFNYHLLRLRLLRYEPDVVISLINSSDLHDVLVRGSMDRFDSEGRILEPTRPLKDHLMARSHLARAMWLLPMPPGTIRNSLSAPGPENIHLVLARLAEAGGQTHALGKEQGFRYLMAVMPHREDLAYPRAGHPLEELPRYAAQEGAEAVDLTPWFRERVSRSEASSYYFEIDQHFNERGYALLAEAVEDTLRQRGLLALEDG